MAPAEALTMKPAAHEPLEQNGAAPLLFAHCASVAQAVHALLAWLQMGDAPLHCVSARQEKQAPEASQNGWLELLPEQALSLAQATHACEVPSQMGAVPEHCVLLVHWFASEKVAVVGALGVEATTA